MLDHVTDPSRFIHDDTCYNGGWPAGSTTISRAGGRVRMDNVGGQLGDMVDIESKLRGVGMKNQATWIGCKMIPPPVPNNPHASLPQCSSDTLVSELKDDHIASYEQ